MMKMICQPKNETLATLIWSTWDKSTYAKVELRFSDDYVPPLHTG